MRALLLVALIACGSKEQAQPQPGSGSGSGSSTADLLPQPDFKVEEDFPDETWKRLGKLAARQWAQSMNKLGITTLKLSPLKSPDGQIAPYVIQAQALKGSTVVFDRSALMSQKAGMISGSGIKRLEEHLAAIGFPAKQLSLGHLVEMFFLANVERAWLVQPSATGWKLDKPAPATLVYDDNGALLTVFRDKDGGLQKIEIRIDKGGLVTTAKLKKSGETWERLTE